MLSCAAACLRCVLARRRSGKVVLPVNAFGGSTLIMLHTGCCSGVVRWLAGVLYRPSIKRGHGTLSNSCNSTGTHCTSFMLCKHSADLQQRRCRDCNVHVGVRRHLFGCLRCIAVNAAYLRMLDFWCMQKLGSAVAAVRASKVLQLGYGVAVGRTATLLTRAMACWCPASR